MSPRIARRRERSAATYRIRGREQLEAVCSPVRQDIVDTVAALGPCSVAQLAEQLGRRPDSLYYHIHALTRAGLLVEHDEPRQLATPGRRMGIAFRRENLDLHRKSMLAMLRLTQRDVERFELEPGKDPILPWGGRVTGWVTKAEREEIAAHFKAIESILTHGKRGRRRSLHAVSWLHTPLPTKDGR